MFSRLIRCICSTTRGYRSLNRDDSNDVEKSTEETPLIVKAPASPNHSGDLSNDKSKGIGKEHPAVEILEQFEKDFPLRGHTKQNDTVFVDSAIKKPIDESYDTIDCTSEISSKTSELLPSEQHLEVSTGFFESVFKATQRAGDILSKMENEQSNRLRYNSKTYISTSSWNNFLGSLEATQSLTNALETEGKESSRAELSVFRNLSQEQTHQASSEQHLEQLGQQQAPLPKKNEDEKNSRIVP